MNIGSVLSQWGDSDRSSIVGQRRGEGHALKKRVITSRDSGVQADTELHSYTPSIEDPASKPSLARAKPVVPFSKRRGVNPPKAGKDSPTLTEKAIKSWPWQETSLAKTTERLHELALHKPLPEFGKANNVDSGRIRGRNQRHDSTHFSPRQRRNQDSSQWDSQVHGSVSTKQDNQNMVSPSAAQFYLSHSRYTPLTSNKHAVEPHRDRVGFGSRAPRFSHDVPPGKRLGPVKKGDGGAFGSHLPTVVGWSPKRKHSPVSTTFGNKTNVTSVAAGWPYCH